MVKVRDRLSKKSGKIACILAGLSERCQAQIWRGISDQALLYNMSCFTFIGEFILKHYRRQGYYSRFKDFIHTENFAGVIILAGAVSHFSKEPELKKLIDHMNPLPVVTVGISIENTPAVIIDNREKVQEVTEHLIDCHNRRHIAFVKGPPGHSEATERFSGYREALDARGIRFDSELVIEGDFSEESGRRAVESLIDKNVFFDALIASDDSTALGALGELQKREIAVPGSVALAGFDDQYSAALVEPALTTVRQNFYLQGTRAVSQLKEIICSGKQLPNITLPGDLVIRQSCGCSHSHRAHPVRQDIKGEESMPGLYRKIVKSLGSEVAEREKLIRLADNIMEVITAFESEPGAPAYSETFPLRWRLQEISKSILTTSSLEDLIAILYRELPALDIKSAYMCLYEKSGTGEPKTIVSLKSSLVMAYNEKGIIHHKSALFSAAALLPGRMMEQLATGNYIFLPLAFDTEHYGYILFEHTPDRQPDVYETLRIYISSVIKSFYLVERVCRAGEEKNSFFVNIAHEIKTPLTLIGNYLDDYMNKHHNPEPLSIVRENIEKLTLDMTNLLDNEKLERGQTFYDYSQVFNISSLVSEKCTLFKKLTDRKGLTLVTRVPNNLLCTFDPLACDRVLNNLIDNAVRYNTEGGQITVSLKEKGKNVQISIEDTGIGIESTQLSTIFNAYHQVSSKKQNIQGIGMGLHIVKNILDKGGGSVEVQSTPDRGTLFTIGLPGGVDNGENRIAEPFLPLGPPDMYSEKVIECAAYDEAKYTILIVEDNINMLSFLASALKENYNIFYGANGYQALNLIETIPRPHLIISDIMMDRMDGYEFFKALREKGSFSTIPFIFLTAKNGPEDRLKGLSKGAVDYIRKPFKIEELLAKIKSLISLITSRDRYKQNQLESRVLQAIRCGPGSSTEYGLLEKNCLHYKITAREKEIILLLLKGDENKEISYKLGISFNTVRTHIRNIYEKCRVQNKIELINLLRE